MEKDTVITKRGVCLDLKKSKYFYKIGNFLFYFSSQFYLNKFKNNYVNYIETESLKIVQKYDVSVNFALFLALAYYKKVEKRGFRVLYNNVEISSNCLFFSHLWGAK